MKEVQTTVETLLKRAMDARNSDDAMRFTQAALNAAHIKYALEKH